MSDAYSLSIFISNIKPDISKSVRLFNPKTLTHALNLAKQMEMLMYNLPRKPFSPYKNPTIQTPPYQNVLSTTKTSSVLNPTQLPGLLPTPKTPFIFTHNSTCRHLILSGIAWIKCA